MNSSIDSDSPYRPQAKRPKSKRAKTRKVYQFIGQSIKTPILPLNPFSQTHKIHDKHKNTSILSQLQNFLLKPPSVSFRPPNRLRGNYGHSTIAFGKPIIEGWFMVQVLLLPSKPPIDLKFKSALRVGCCPWDFDINLPLGCRQSIGYKSADGCMINESKVIQQLVEYEVGDTIGVGLQIVPPRKHQNSSQIQQGSVLQVYKNGNKIGEWEGLRQIFYRLGVSLYNYAEVQIVETGYPVGYLSWSATAVEEIMYPSLENHKAFRI